VCSFPNQQCPELNAGPSLTDKTPEERAKLLETTPLFANIHADAAATGQTGVPDNLDTDLHFTCFVQSPGVGTRKTETGSSPRLIELDGGRVGPVDRGECTDLLLVRRVDSVFRSVYNRPSCRTLRRLSRMYTFLSLRACILV
jgi:hypothetical protein